MALGLSPEGQKPQNTQTPLYQNGSDERMTQKMAQPGGQSGKPAHQYQEQNSHYNRQNEGFYHDADLCLCG